MLAHVFLVSEIIGQIRSLWTHVSRNAVLFAIIFLNPQTLCLSIEFWPQQPGSNKRAANSKDRRRKSTANLNRPSKLNQPERMRQIYEVCTGDLPADSLLQHEHPASSKDMRYAKRVLQTHMSGPFRDFFNKFSHSFCGDQKMRMVGTCEQIWVISVRTKHFLWSEMYIYILQGRVRGMCYFFTTMPCQQKQFLRCAWEHIIAWGMSRC